MIDVLYVVGSASGWQHNELRYSLRSLENFPHGKVILSGHCPTWAKGVVKIPGRDSERERQRNVQSKILRALESGHVGERFALFCDDMYILQPWTSNRMRYCGRLVGRLERVRRTHGKGDQWRKAIEATLRACQELGVNDPLDCGAHHPQVMERDRAIETLEYSMSLPTLFDIATVYLATHGGEAEKVSNAKTLRWRGVPTGEVYSSCPAVESHPGFRKWVAGRFPRKGRYEV